jgi:membrane protein
MQLFLNATKESARTFWVDDYTYQASALSFLTLLAMVPFLSIITFLVNLSGKYVWIFTETTKFIYANFLPSSGNIIESYLQKFAQSASNLPLFSIIFFGITVLMLINTLETTLNRIWNVKAYRSLFNKLISWSAMLILPLFIAVTTIANDFINIFFRNYVISLFFLKLTVFILHVVIFTMLYTLVPNVRLKFKNALSGGILVGILFHLLKFIFVIYVVYFTNFSAIYGSLAVIPVFLTWLYFSWSVFLYGAIYIHKHSQFS